MDSYSNTLVKLAQKPKHRGAYFMEDAKEKNMALVESKYKDIKLYILVRPEDDIIYSTKFFAYGGTLSLAIGEKLCQLIENKKVDELSLSPEVVAKELDYPTANLSQPVTELINAIIKNYPPSKAIALATQKIKINKKLDLKSLSEKEREWVDKPIAEKIKSIESLLDAQVRPGLNMDGGDITILGIEDHYKLKVRWEGACGGCSSSMGATLSFIEDKLRKNIFECLEIIADNTEIERQQTSPFASSQSF